MNQTISIDGKTFKQFRDTQYYCDDLGNIYSNFSKRILKPMLRGPKNKKYHYVDINFGEGQKHCMVHRIVYETWKGEIPKDLYVLHKDDNSLNNAVENLYLGTQKENIADCKNNNHRVGHTWILTLYDKKKNKKLPFVLLAILFNILGIHPQMEVLKECLLEIGSNKDTKLLIIILVKICL